MGNLSGTLKKFMGNKNTVTIVGVLICILVLYFGYNYRVNKAVKMVRVPYALETIQPKTKITSEMIGYMEVPESFEGNYYTYGDINSLIGKYSSYNTIIPAGSLFYDEFVITEDKIPDAVFYNVKKGYVVDNYKVGMDTTYANSIMPDSLIDIYVKYNNNGKVSYGKFFENVSVLAVKDGSGANVFENTEESRTPAYMFLSLPKTQYYAFKLLQYARDEFSDYGIEIVIVPNTQEYTAENEGAVKVSSNDILAFVEDKITKIDSQDEEFNKLKEDMANQKLEDENQDDTTDDNSDTNNDSNDNING
mgnify:CR=1 FL=1